MAAGYDPAVSEFIRTQRRGVNDQYNISLAGLNKKKQEVERVYGTNQRNLGHTQMLQRRQLPGEYIGRGIRNSGIFGRAVSELGRTQLQEQGQLQQGRLGQLDEISQLIAQITGQRNASLADLDSRMALNRSALASGLVSGFQMPTFQLPGLNVAV